MPDLIRLSHLSTPVANRSVISGMLGAFGELVERLSSWDLLSTMMTIVETICSDKVRAPRSGMSPPILPD